MQVEDYDLISFMEANNVTGPSPGLASLIDIVAELVAPAMEVRQAWTELTPKQMFLLCNHESDDTLKPGRLVDVSAWRIDIAVCCFCYVC